MPIIELLDFLYQDMKWVQLLTYSDCLNLKMDESEDMQMNSRQWVISGEEFSFLYAQFSNYQFYIQTEMHF